MLSLDFLFSPHYSITIVLSRAQLFATPWTVACPAALTMAILPERILGWVAMPSSRNLPNSGIKPRSPELWVDSLLSEPSGKPHSCSAKAQLINCQTNEKTNRQIKKKMDLTKMSKR